MSGVAAGLVDDLGHPVQVDVLSVDPPDDSATKRGAVSLYVPPYIPTWRLPIEAVATNVSKRCHAKHKLIVQENNQYNTYNKILYAINSANSYK